MTAVEPEFSRPLTVDTTQAVDATHHIQANDAERAALAERFGIEALDSLAAEVRLSCARGGALVRLSTDFTADVVQACVVSLQPVASRIEASFERLYDPSAAPPDADGEAAPISGDETPDGEAAEPLAGGVLDLGEIVAEELALELNPFPRAPGVDFHEFLPKSAESRESEEKEDEKPGGPFASLAKLVEDGD